METYRLAKEESRLSIALPVSGFMMEPQVPRGDFLACDPQQRDAETNHRKRGGGKPLMKCNVPSLFTADCVALIAEIIPYYYYQWFKPPP